MPEQDVSPVIMEQEASARVDDKLVAAIGRASLIIVTGRPLIRWTDSPIYYNDNQREVDVPLQVSFLRMVHIPELAHMHLDSAFIGDYPAIGGIDEDGVECLFGLRPELDFSYHIPTDVETI